MKILFFTYPVAFITPGGGEVQLLETRTALQNLGVTVDLFDPWKPNIDQYDVIHLFSVQSGVRHLQILAQQHGIKVVNSPIMWIQRGAGNYDMQNLYSIMANSDLVLPNSNAEKNCFLDFYDLPDEKYHVAYNGVDPSVLTPASPDVFSEKFNIEKNSYLLCVANIEPRKNQYRLIEAANQLNLPLVLMGHVRDRNYFEECKTIMRDNCHYVGPLEHGSELFRSAFAGCKMHVLAGLLETPGLSSMEAATLGASIVSTQVGSAFEYFGDLIQYCDPCSADSVAQAISRTMEVGVDTKKLSEHMLQKFTWQQTAQQTLKAYEAVLK